MSDTPRITVEALTARYEADHPAAAGGRDAGGAARRVAAILDALGWQSASDVPSGEVAPEVTMMLGACVRRHRDLEALRRSIADCLRRYSHPLDGSGASVVAWEPFAAQLMGRYAAAAQGGPAATGSNGGADAS